MTITEWKSKSDMVADALRDLIDSGELKPGDMLRQRDIAKRFNTSPTPVREALHRLEAEGYVESRLHHGATVRGEVARLSENFLIRATLEGLATELAVKKITDERIDQIEEINERLAQLDSEDPRRFAMNRELHFCLYEAAESPVLNTMLNVLWESLGEGPGHGRPLMEAVTEHRALIEALRARDSRSATRHIREHIERGLEYETAER